MNFKEFREKLKWLDPFTYVDLYIMPKVNPNKSEAISWIVYLISAFVFAWLIYTGLGIILGTESPMMIVVSGSMEPLYHRGDIIVLQGTNAESLKGIEVQVPLSTLRETPLESFASVNYSNGPNPSVESISFDSGQEIPVTQEGSIVVYWSSHMQEPIIHRVVAKLEANDGWYILTKGDSVHNNTVDQDCSRIINGRPEKGCIEFYPVPVEEIQGKAVLQVPFVGCIKLWLLDDLGSLFTRGQLPAEFQQGNVC